MFAAVDLGSNSFRLHIGHYDGNAIRVIKSAREPIRMAAGLDASGNLTAAAMQTALECLARFKTLINSFELDAVRVVGTNTLRIAKNAASFLPAAEQALGYPIEIISGEEEGRLIYMGVACGLATLEDRRLVIDIGGGSTELILGRGHEIERVESFSIGTFRQSLDFFPQGRIDAACFDAAILSARSIFEDAALSYARRHWQKVYGSSGTMRAISDAISKNGIGDGSLSLKNLTELKARLIGFGHTSRILLAGMKPDRASVIIGGLAILLGLMHELGIDTMTPIEAGLRMGVLWDLQLRATQRDRRERSVDQFRARFHANPVRAREVADTASQLYAQLKTDSDALVKYVHWSGQLHEIGVAVSHSGYHKHAAYLMLNADLPGFTAREQRTMSNLILAQKGNLKKMDNALEDAELCKAVLAMRLAVMFMHSHCVLQPEDVRIKMRHRIEIELKADWIARYPTVSYWMEKERETWGEIGIDFSIKRKG
jgi:exopolyphosphatase/guanosine-5'-triphosphate,3'-diphosphate pyrophosphatase